MMKHMRSIVFRGIQVYGTVAMLLLTVLQTGALADQPRQPG